jgi:hypothetical protein
MRKHMLIAAAAAISTLGSAALAQQTGNDGSIATETQERRSEGQDNDFPWDLLGLLGLAGLLGLKRRDDPNDRRSN